MAVTDYESCECMSIGNIGGAMPVLSTRASEVEKLVEVAKTCGIDASPGLFADLMGIVYLGINPVPIWEEGGE